MEGVAETARKTTINAQRELDRRFEAMKQEIKAYRQSIKE